MRINWLIPLAALALTSCQAREPQAPGRPGSQAAAPPAATAPVPPPPTLEPAPRTASAPACPPATAQPACPPTTKAATRKVRAPARPAARPQAVADRRERAVRREVDIPPYGGYRYEDLEDREIARRYAERRYQADRRYDHREADRDRESYRAEPPPPPLAQQERYDRHGRHETYGREDRYGGARMEDRREHHDGHARGGYARRETYVERRPLAPVHGGVRRYEDRSYEETARYRESYRESGASWREEVRGQGPCCLAPSAEAAGRDANGLLTWPGKVPAIP